MLRQHRLIQLAVVGTILLSLFVGGYLFASKRFSKPGPSATVVKHTVDTHADDALKYWTADKMRNAKAADLPDVKDLKPVKKQPRRPPV